MTVIHYIREDQASPQTHHSATVLFISQSLTQQIMEHNKVDTELQDSYDDQQKWVLDSSTDSRGKIPLRARTGAWRAALFIIGIIYQTFPRYFCIIYRTFYVIILWFYLYMCTAIEFSERLSYFGIATNLVVYLTTILHQDLKMAVKNANYWSGVTTLMPLLGGFVADAYLGRYATVLLATTIYLMVIVFEN